MTDRKTAISNLETNIRWIEDIPCHQFPGWWNVTMSMRDALELLKEQEPLEPTRVEIEQAGPLYHRCYCKKCGHHVGNMISNKVAEVHENFCSICGQKVKWNDEQRSN